MVPKILIVEDDKAVGNLIETTLETQGYEFFTARTGQDAILQAASQKPDIMILDLGLPDFDGVQVIEKIRNWSEVPIIVVSADLFFFNTQVFYDLSFAESGNRHKMFRVPACLFHAEL